MNIKRRKKMSLRYEQYNALKRSRDLLRRLLTTDRPKTVKELKEEASRCLKHFPFLSEKGKPYFSNDNFSDECD